MVDIDIPLGSKLTDVQGWKTYYGLRTVGQAEVCYICVMKPLKPAMEAMLACH